MNEIYQRLAKEARKLASECVEGTAPEFGVGRLSENGRPCCALGHLGYRATGDAHSALQGTYPMGRIERVKAGSAEYKHEKGTSTVWLSGDSLCTPGTDTAAPVECWEKATGPSARELIDTLENIEWRKVLLDALLAFHRAAVKAEALP